MARRKKKRPDRPEGSLDFSVDTVCRNEIEAAIDALVIDENLIAAHVLASAAHDVMRGHADRVGRDLKADMLTILKPLVPGREKSLIDALLAPYNAMKHSNSSDVAVTVHPSLVEATLFCSTQEYGSLFGHLSGKMVFYVAWYTAVQPSLRGVNGTKPKFLTTAFPSASGPGPRSLQMKELREVLVQLILEPERLTDAVSRYSTDGLWDKP
ncbi:hypothetical protein U1763_19735 [Sphingomonas sp. LB2R24]|uniref:hypothetical protein n=1 Tax=Sphingomonas sorbitolis TaxID=3096165 RepID=UPI002FC6CC72